MANVLRIKDFRLALCVRLFDSLAMQMLTVVVGWQIYQLTRDPLYLGCIGLALAAPYIAVALWAGHVVDRREKRAITLLALSGSFISSLMLTGLSLTKDVPLLPIYLCLGVVGLSRSFQFPALVTYVQLIVPKEVFPKAAAWQTSVFQAATIAGPLLGGLIYGAFGVTAAYAAVAACLIAAMIFAAMMNRLEALALRDESPRLEQFLSGIRFTLSQPVILAAMSLDMFGVLFAGVDGVLPMFAAGLGVGPLGLGMLQAAPAAGALSCSLYLTRHQPFRRKGAAFMTALGTFGICLILFGLSHVFVLSLALLAISGVADGASMVIRASIYQELTPDHLRGRVSAVNGIFIRASNQLGYFESGLAAKMMGLVPSVLFGGCVTLASVGMAAWKAPKLRKYEN